jgi:hypothetical protein
MSSHIASFWCEKMGESHRRHRKVWEWVFVTQVLALGGMLAPGRRGVGFGIGSEPLTDLFASYGCEITATDLDFESAKREGWVDTLQHADKKETLYRGITTRSAFDARVRHCVVDMNDVPPDLAGYDFTWSSCSLEHLGSLDNGLAFIEKSLACLRPGGIAVHTTELNCSSDEETISQGCCVLYRQRDFREFADRMAILGHSVAPLNFHLGSEPEDKYVDVPPFKHDPHFKLQLEKFVTTSFGVIVRAKTP